MADTIRQRCRHLDSEGTRCSQPSLRQHDLCKKHRFEQQVAVIHAHRIPDIQPILPAVTLSDDRDYDEIIVNLSLIMGVLLHGNPTPDEAKRMNLLARTCNRTLRAIHYVERLRDSILLDLARISRAKPSRNRPSHTIQ